MMKTNQCLLLAACAFGVLTVSPKLLADNSPMPSCCMGASAEPMADVAKATPDLLKTCPVSGDKLDGDMGKPYVFVYKGQEVKLCCKGCMKDFDKDPAKYMKLIRAADKTDKK